MSESAAGGAGGQAIACPACQKQFRWKDTIAGRNAQCTGCGRMLRFPATYAVTALLAEGGAAPATNMPASPPPSRATSAARPPASPAATSAPKADNDFGEYDIREDTPAPPKPVQAVQSVQSQSYASPLNYPSAARVAPMSRANATQLVAAESTGLFVFRVIAMVFNGLLAAGGLICLFLCNPCVFVPGLGLGSANLNWLIRGEMDSGQRILAIVVNGVGIVIGLFFVCMFLLADLVPVQQYGNTQIKIRTLLMAVYIPFGSIVVLACLSTMIYACLQPRE